MKTLFDSAIRQELSQRINSVTTNNGAQWGKMNAYQMVKHCVKCDDMFLGELKIKRVFVGRLIGKMILKRTLKNDAPFGKNSPTSPLLMINENEGDLELQKQEWLKRVNQYATYNREDFVHPFFGPMTKEQIGMFAYKHADHHLRQFGA